MLRSVEVVYLEHLAAEAIADASVREQFIDDILKESQRMDSGHPYILRGDSFLIEFLLYVHQP
jgi:arginine deiminase